ncbi:hypothetical protein FHT76_001292 [Rhizobium sp. BK176]|nr:hypothetical protein [Rhizobium sp. BK176]
MDDDRREDGGDGWFELIVEIIGGLFELLAGS